MYAVLQINKEIEVSVRGGEVTVALSYADGMVGAMPVFDTMESAESFAGDKYHIAKVTVSASAVDDR